MDRFTEKGQFLAFAKANYRSAIILIILMSFVSSYFSHKPITESLLITLSNVGAFLCILMVAYWFCRLSDKELEQSQKGNVSAGKRFLFRRDVKKLYLWWVVFFPLACAVASAIVAISLSEKVQIIEMAKVALIAMGLSFFSLTFAILFWTIVEAWTRHFDKKEIDKDSNASPGN